MAARKIMIFQHVGHEPLGTLDPMLKAAGFRIRYVNFGRTPDFVPSLEGYSGLIVLGGPMGVYEAKQHKHLLVEMKLIEEALKKNIPVLGICLGSQLIANVLGSDVKKAPQAEMGWHEVHLTDEGKKDNLFGEYKTPEKIFQLHQDMFDPPQAAIHLATSDLCPGQAFRYGDKVYGFQFHLEVDQAMILRWLARKENQAMLPASDRHQLSELIRTDTERHITRSLDLSTAVFGKFIEMFQLPEKQIILGSTHGGPRRREK
ncbi:MAG: type 1 glutamine amidotransferase [Bdellovibrionales bacterium]